MRIQLAYGGAQQYCFTNVPFMGKVYAVCKHYGLVRRKSATTQPVLSLVHESTGDLNSVYRFPLHSRQRSWTATYILSKALVSITDLLSTCRHLLDVSFKKSLLPNSCTETTTQYTTENNCTVSHAHSPIALQSTVFLIGILEFLVKKCFPKCNKLSRSVANSPVSISGYKKCRSVHVFLTWCSTCTVIVD